MVNLNAAMTPLQYCLQCCKQSIFSKNTGYFYAVRISISLAILSAIFIQIGHYFCKKTKVGVFLNTVYN